MNTWSRAGHWPFDAASRIGWKLTFENRESVRSSRPMSQNSPRTSLLRGAIGESRQKTKTGLLRSRQPHQRARGLDVAPDDDLLAVEEHRRRDERFGRGGEARGAGLRRARQC